MATISALEDYNQFAKNMTKALSDLPGMALGGKLKENQRWSPYTNEHGYKL
jgi:hypothetical protein